MQTEILAWCGAVISTVVLVWDVLKWRGEHPRLRIRAVTAPEDMQNSRIDISIANRGGKPTTIESLYLANYRSLVPALWRGLISKEALFTTNLVLEEKGYAQWPFVLEPGRLYEVTGSLDDSEKRESAGHEDLRGLIKAGKLFLHVKCSHRDRPFAVCVRPASPFDAG